MGFLQKLLRPEITNTLFVRRSYNRNHSLRFLPDERPDKHLWRPLRFAVWHNHRRTALFPVLAQMHRVKVIGARYVFDAMKLRDPAIRGFAIGIASHGIGTARAFQVNEQSGAFAALAMGLNGALTAMLLPFIARWLG